MREFFTDKQICKKNGLRKLPQTVLFFVLQQRNQRNGDHACGHQYRQYDRNDLYNVSAHALSLYAEYGGDVFRVFFGAGGSLFGGFALNHGVDLYFGLRAGRPHHDLIAVFSVHNDHV